MIRRIGIISVFRVGLIGDISLGAPVLFRFAEQNWRLIYLLNSVMILHNNWNKNKVNFYFMKILITGGAGFIGSNIARACLKKGYQVRIIDNLSTGKLENIRDIRKKVKFVKADINNPQALSKIMKGVDVVFHEAALASVIRSFIEPLKVNEYNITGTLNVLWQAKLSKVKRVIYAASSAAYGNSKIYPVKESFLPRPISNYGVSKLTGEYYCQAFYYLYGLETICLRYFNLFGPYQDPHSEYAAVIPRFITAVLNNKPVTIYGDGKQSRDFTFVENVVEANLKALVAPKAACGQVYNIACGQRISLLEIVRIMEELLKKKIKINFHPARRGDVKHSLADIILARKYLKFTPKINFKKGLKQTILWYQKKNK